MSVGKLVLLCPGNNLKAEPDLSHDLIYRQVNKIRAHRLFSVSPILSKFLFFVVHETLSGNEHQIKEYTIGVQVLGKPKKFRPQTDGIVRVHATRLRRALMTYYNSENTDEVIIKIPSGGYIPVFQPSRFVMKTRPAVIPAQMAVLQK